MRWTQDFIPGTRANFVFALVLLGALGAVLVAWHLLHVGREDQLRAETDKFVDFVAARLEAHTASRLAMGELVRQEWRDGLITDAGSFARQAHSKLQQFPDLQAINWVDPSGVIRWVTPIDGNRAALGLDIMTLEAPGAALRRAAQTGRMQITEPIRLAQGGQGFAAYLPISANDGAQGFINVVFRIDRLVRTSALTRLRRDRSFKVIDAISGKALYVPADFPERETADEPVLSRSISIGNRVWRVIARPATARETSAWLYPENVMLVAGVLFSLIVALLAHALYQRHERLVRSERRFADFATISSDWFWEMDADMRFSYFSSQFEKVTGVPPDELLGRTRAEVGAPGASPAALEHLLRDMEAHLPFRDFEHHRVRPDGTVAHLAISGQPIFSPEGRFEGYRGVGRDISHQKESQVALRDALRAEQRASRAKSDFLATMSHEFRTPLNAIIGFSDILIQEVFGPLGSQRYIEYARDIHKSGEHMLGLINDVLDISAVEAGKRRYEIEPVALADVLPKCLRHMEHGIAEKDLALVQEIAPNLPTLRADRRALFQIMLNLLSNAVKYTEPGGRITLAAQAVGSRVEINLADTGVGIPSDKLAHIAEPFTKAHSDPHLSQEGTGLGLSIVKALTDALGGTLAIESEIGRGTTVTLTFPAAGEEADGGEDAGQASPSPAMIRQAQ